MWGRIRAICTPQTALYLALMLAVSCLLLSRAETKQTVGLEMRASQILSRIDGAGEVQVVIAMSGEMMGGVTGGLAARQEQQTPVGAVAVAEGADDPIVAMRIVQTLSSLLGLPAAAISVVDGGG
ncbi:MAG: hypothetical protein J6K32_01305 [Clostridia bacterium]|nr:hypothetical protein [Clostridia bacterium]